MIHSYYCDVKQYTKQCILLVQNSEQDFTHILFCAILLLLFSGITFASFMITLQMYKNIDNVSIIISCVAIIFSIIITIITTLSVVITLMFSYLLCAMITNLHIYS